jgi:sulfonate transport system substrate-binding protein
MMHTTRRGLLAAGLALAAFGAQAQAPAPLAEPVKLVIGAAKVGHLAPLVAVPAMLEPLGVELEIVEFVRYADARTALATGSLDMATVGPADLPIALSQGIETMVALMGVGGSPKYVVARNGLELNSWEDLKGKKIAIAPGSAVWFQFVATLTEKGIPYDSIEAVNIQGGGANFNQALQRGDVDAIITWEPFESTPVIEGYGYWAENLDYSTSEAVGAELGMIAASKDAAENKTEALKRFIWAYTTEQNRLAADKAAFAEAVQAWTGISPAIAARIADSIELGAVLSLDQLQRQAKTFHELGVIQTDVSGQIPAFFAADLVAEAAAK